MAADLVTISGTVIDRASQLGCPDVIVRLEGSVAHLAETRSGQDGEFAFVVDRDRDDDAGEGAEDAQDMGVPRWRLVVDAAQNPLAVVSGDAIAVDVAGGGVDGLRLTVVGRPVRGSTFGGTVFIAVVVLLGVLTAHCYVDLHVRCRNHGEPVNTVLSGYLLHTRDRLVGAAGPGVEVQAHRPPQWCSMIRGATRHDGMDVGEQNGPAEPAADAGDGAVPVAGAGAPPVVAPAPVPQAALDDRDGSGAGVPHDGSPSDGSGGHDPKDDVPAAGRPASHPDEMLRLVETARLLLSEVNAAKPMPVLAPEEVSAARAMFDLAEARIRTKDYPGAAQVLDGLDLDLRRGRGFFWSAHPLRLLEIWFWAFFATLIRLLISSGIFVRRGRFLPRAVTSQVTLMVCVPVLAVLISLLLGLVALDFSVADSGLTIDMSDIRTSVLVAAFIGFSPWRAWDFLTALGDTFFAWLEATTRGRNSSGTSDNGSTP